MLKCLGPSLGELRAHLNQSWRDQACERWKEWYEQHQAHAARLMELEGEADRRPLSIREQWERATLTGFVHGNQWGVARFRQLVRARPHSPYARLALTRVLLDERDDAGLHEAEMAVQLGPEVVDDALELVEKYLLRGARLAELEEYRRRFGAVREVLEADDNRSYDFKADDEYLPHGVPLPELAPLLDLLDRCPYLESAHLVRWRWPSFPDVTIFLLAAVPDPAVARKDSTFMEIFQHLAGAPEMPGCGRLWVSSRGNPDVDQAIARVESALIYERADREDRLVA